MVPMDEYERIRHAHRVDRMSIRELARRFHHSRRKIREILAQPEPKPYRRRPVPSVVDPFKPVIDAILRADEAAPRKQRHTVAKIVRRLRDEHGYTGGYERVRYYVRGQRPAPAATFIPLDHDPGQRLECDFGRIHVDFPDGRRPVPVLLATWAYSNSPFAVALLTQRTEVILHGLVAVGTPTSPSVSPLNREQLVTGVLVPKTTRRLLGEDNPHPAAALSGSSPGLSPRPGGNAHPPRPAATAPGRPPWRPGRSRPVPRRRPTWRRSRRSSPCRSGRGPPPEPPARSGPAPARPRAGTRGRRTRAAPSP